MRVLRQDNALIDTVTFNIRDKSAEQYQYLIDFKENKTLGLSNTAVKNLLRADQVSYSNSIPQSAEKSIISAKKSSERRAISDAEYLDAIITEKDLENEINAAGLVLTSKDRGVKISA